MQITAKVNEFIRNNNLLNDNDKIVVGVSGGADSMALLAILGELGYYCIAAHCNFHLRDGESDRDYLFVKDFCQQNHIEFVSIDFDTYVYMAEKAISLEMAARELRYNWFRQVKKEFAADKIAVAHHLDDSVETVLINLIRGTGIRGLRGISPKNGDIVRPLLCLYRNEILEYLDIHQINFVTDSTNNENIYIRNKIRLDVIPLLKAINPSAVQSIVKTSENLAATEKIYNGVIENIRKKLLFDNKISIDLLKQQEEPQNILFELLYPYGFNIYTVENIFDSLDGISGKTFYSQSHRIIKDRKFLIIEEKKDKKENTYIIEKDCTSIDTPLRLSIETLEKDSLTEIEKNPYTIYIDKDTIHYPLTIRRWQKGDRFVPFGMKGHKKVSDFFSNQKYSLIEKENTWLLCSQDKIIWIIGKRSDDRFKITDTTTNILKIILKDYSY